ncbi:acyl-coenzyme A thioesterase 9, mitochondrial-like [Bacillus rossius redtenbacheri]|uniref:acyl-coenzyme A thioesterase 9, mitochondrial-like n=1 Tax=Bacillus rossius redtenbacheri TaxID=93214 RepID=UPI002FDCE9E2
MRLSVLRHLAKTECFRRSNIIKSQCILSNSICFYSTQNAEPTMHTVKSKLIQLMGIDRAYKPLQTVRSHLLSQLPASQDELPERSMQDSFTSAIIPLSEDFSLQDKYVTFLGSVRMGRLLEDMDMFAVWVAHKHLHDPRSKPGDVTPYVIVTVLVDQIDFTDHVPKSDRDIRLSGHVSWVGRSSLEAVVWLEQDAGGGNYQRLTRALFLMAARNSTNSGPAVVNRLAPKDEHEREILAGGEDRKRRRTRQKGVSLLKSVPDAEEQGLVHSLFLRSVDLHSHRFARVLPPGGRWMGEAKQNTIVFSHPEDRNLHNNVFGGFLMRHALELAWTSAYLYGKYRPKICHISDINFVQPVNVGSLLQMHSQVVFTQHNYMQIVVHAEVFDATSGHPTTTNVFHYTYTVPEVVASIYPRSYGEAMKYLEGRRHFLHVMGLEGSK